VTLERERIDDPFAFCNDAIHAKAEQQGTDAVGAEHEDRSLDRINLPAAKERSTQW